MMDFSNLPENYFRLYNGANGKKKCLLFNNEPYMVKIMDNDSNKAVHPMSAYSEYIACHIYNMLGIPAQETILGTYTSKGNTYLAVACKDFCGEDDRLQDFSNIRNAIVSSSGEGGGKELYPLLVTLEEQKLIPEADFKERFWNMFVVDALIGNFDRHSGNFGIIMNSKTRKIELAPVYDCGSALYPSLSDEMIPAILNDEKQILSRIYEFPASTYRDADNKKIKYHILLSSNDYPDCTNALIRLKPIIDTQICQIYSFINNISEISDIRKKFYTTMLKYRKELIIDNAYDQVVKKENETYINKIPNIEIIHKREEALFGGITFNTNIANEYAHLYRTIERQDNSDRHKRNSDTDAIIISIMRKEGYTKDEIKHVCEQLSPASIGRNDYIGRMFIKSKLPKFANITRENLVSKLKDMKISHSH